MGTPIPVRRVHPLSGHRAHRALCSVTPPHFCRLFDGLLWPRDDMLLYVRFGVVFLLFADEIAIFRSSLTTLYVLFLAAEHALLGGVTLHCDQKNRSCERDDLPLNTKQATPGTSPGATAARCEHVRGATSGSEEPLLVTEMGSVLRPLGDLVPHIGLLLRPSGDLVPANCFICARPASWCR